MPGESPKRKRRRILICVLAALAVALVVVFAALHMQPGGLLPPYSESSSSQSYSSDADSSSAYQSHAEPSYNQTVNAGSLGNVKDGIFSSPLCGIRIAPNSQVVFDDFFEDENDGSSDACLASYYTLYDSAGEYIGFASFTVFAENEEDGYTVDPDIWFSGSDATSVKSIQLAGKTFWGGQKNTQDGYAAYEYICSTASYFMIASVYCKEGSGGERIFLSTLQQR